MTALVHLLLALLATFTIWILSGMLIDATDRVAKRYNKPGFAVAFFVLGILTSISEISVATNATLQGVPQVSGGNLLGASTVIFLLIIPLLATLGNGIPMTNALRPSNVALLLFVVALPALLAFDGSVSVSEGAVMLLLYMTLIFRIQKIRPTEETARRTLRETERELLHKTHATAVDLLKIVVGAVLIFIAGNILVEESVYMAIALSIPVSFIGLLLLSIGTNIPELVIALRCVVGRHKDIAFGDYMGSAAANTLIFGFLSLGNGTFALERSEAMLTFFIMAVGFTLFFFFARSKEQLSRGEGIGLLCMYALFLLLQIGNAVRLSDEHLPLESLKRAAPELSQAADAGL